MPRGHETRLEHTHTRSNGLIPRDDLNVVGVQYQCIAISGSESEAALT